MLVNNESNKIFHCTVFYTNYLLQLTNEERDSFVSIFSDLSLSAGQDLHNDSLLTEIEIRSRQLSTKLSRRLIDFRKNSNEYGMLLIRNLPIDYNLPITPKDGRRSSDKTSFLSEFILLSAMLHLGDPIAYLDEKEGNLIQNICPVAGKEEAQENSGSVYLEFHTENAFHPHKPDFLGLLCLRPDHDAIAATASASVRQAISMVPSKAQEILRQPLFRIRLSSSFMSEGRETLYSSLMPVLEGDFLDPEMSVDFYGMEAINVAGQLALQALEQALLSVTKEIKLTPGDLMIIDNRVSAHARTSFTPKYDGYDRWLQRAFATQNFRRSKGSRPKAGHIYTPFLVEMGSTK